MAGGLILLGLVLVTVGLTRLEPAAPSVDRSLVWTDEVKLGEMLRQVRGNGLLVPENIIWVPAINQGRVVDEGGQPLLPFPLVDERRYEVDPGLDCEDEPRPELPGHSQVGQPELGAP